MKRLHPATLEDANAGVRLPAYERTTLRPGIVHLGLGAFHRAHQGVYTEDAIGHGGGDWGIVGVSMRSDRVSQQLTPQGGLYSVLSEDAAHTELRIVGAVIRVLVAPENPAAVTAALAGERTRVITLTITEKGYRVAADGASLDRDDPEVTRDLAHPEQPATAIGILALGLRERSRANGLPVSILSCDNLAGNSRVLRSVLVDYLQSTFPGVLPWLERSVTFPCSVVDRIVPAATARQRQRQSQLLGLVDEGAVSTEPFSQWVIEDNFAAGRPDWESAGAQLVDDVEPYENLKLRLLNATHSAIAYCGLLAGLEQVDEAMADPVLEAFIQRLMTADLVPALDVPEGFAITAYRDALLARFRNPCLRHRCAQIAMDGSEKIAQRWLPTLAHTPAPLLRRALAAWCYFILCTDLPVDDPRADQLLAWRNAPGAIEDRLALVLGAARLTPETCPGFDTLPGELSGYLAAIKGEGVLAFLAS
jgi:fructuronate reductase